MTYFMQLGLILASEFGDVPNDFIIDNVNCGGRENALLSCKYSKHHNCGVKEGAGVVCLEPFSKCIFRSARTVEFDENYLHFGTVILTF